MIILCTSIEGFSPMDARADLDKATWIKWSTPQERTKSYVEDLEGMQEVQDIKYKNPKQEDAKKESSRNTAQSH